MSTTVVMMCAASAAQTIGAVFLNRPQTLCLLLVVKVGIGQCLKLLRCTKPFGWVEIRGVDDVLE